MEKHITFNKRMKLADVIHRNYSLLPVINRFGIQMGFGEKTVVEICEEKGINTGFFLDIINTFHDPEYFPEKSLRSNKTVEIVEYLRKTHFYYLNFFIRDMERFIDEMIRNSGQESGKIQIIRKFFLDYKEELILHIRIEEEIVFPYALAVQKKADGIPISEKDDELIRSWSVSEFAEEHSNIDDKLMDLKNIIIKYLPAGLDDNLCNAVIMKLYQLECDIKDHAVIEDKILVPQVLELESIISNSKQ